MGGTLQPSTASVCVRWKTQPPVRMFTFLLSSPPRFPPLLHAPWVPCAGHHPTRWSHLTDDSIGPLAAAGRSPSGPDVSPSALLSLVLCSWDAPVSLPEPVKTLVSPFPFLCEWVSILFPSPCPACLDPWRPGGGEVGGRGAGRPDKEQDGLPDPQGHWGISLCTSGWPVSYAGPWSVKALRACLKERFCFFLLSTSALTFCDS